MVVTCRGAGRESLVWRVVRHDDEFHEYAILYLYMMFTNVKVDLIDQVLTREQQWSKLPILDQSIMHL